VAERGTFVVDREGLLRWQVISPHGAARDVDDLRRALHDLGA
jgi:alkyl hydroperoxide reductase subunit AhpC